MDNLAGYVGSKVQPTPKGGGGRVVLENVGHL